MGTHIDFKECNFFVKAEDKVEAFKFAKNKLLAEVEEKGQAGSWANGVRTITEYSWVTNKEIKDTRCLEDLIEVFGWGVENNENDDIVHIYCGQDKLGQEDCLFEAIAPFVKENSYIEVVIEFESVRWCFRDKKLVEQEAKISWVDCK